MEMDRSDLDRRAAMKAMAAFAALGSLFTPSAQGQEAGAEAHTGAAANSPADLSVSRVFHFDQMPVRNYPNGGWGRQVMHGTLPTGEFVEVHETMLPAGQMPHPPHKHRNTEFVLIRQGQLEFLNDGKPEPVGVGDVVYTASNQMHGMKNVGTTPALYFVVSVSHGQM